MTHKKRVYHGKIYGNFHDNIEETIFLGTLITVNRNKTETKDTLLILETKMNPNEDQTLKFTNSYNRYKHA